MLGTLAKLQQRFTVQNNMADALKGQLATRYGDWHYAPRGQRERLEKFQDRASKAMEAVFVWLDENSPRDWRHGAPCFWVCEHLTESDALTMGQLSVIPPPVYGAHHGDADRFARPVSTLEPVAPW